MAKAPTKITVARAFYTLRRAVRERLLGRAFGSAHLLEATQYFQQAGVVGCIYCGSPDPERWDHLVSVQVGGATVLGNMVPACQPCDDSKGSKDYRAWLAGSAPRNPALGNQPLRDEIIFRLEAFQRRFGYAPAGDFEAALTPEQLTQYSGFLAALATFRTQLVALDLMPPAAREEEPEEDDDSQSNGG